MKQVITATQNKMRHENEYSLIPHGHKSHIVANEPKENKGKSLHDQISESSKAIAGELNIKEDKLAKMLSWNLGHIPGQEQEDILQDMICQLLAKKPQEDGLIFTIARHVVVDFWRAFAFHSQYDIQYGSETIQDGEGNEVEVIDTLSDNLRYEAWLQSNIDASNLFEKLPKPIQKLIQKRMIGHNLSAAERQQLHRWIEANPDFIN